MGQIQKHNPLCPTIRPSNKANLTFGGGEWKGTRLVESDAAAVVEVVAEVVVVGF